MLELKNVRHGFAKHSQTQPLDFTCDASEYCLVYGRSGSGKSTFLRLLMGVHEPSEGTYTVDERPFETIPLSERLELLGFVDQHPDRAVLGSTVAEDIAYSLRFMHLDPLAIHSRVHEALKHLEILPLKERSPHTMSGGQLQLASFAAALAQNSRYLLCDEVTAHIAAPERQRINLTLEALHQSGHGIIRVEHSLTPLLSATRVLVFHDGAIVFDGTPELFIRDDRALSYAGFDGAVSFDTAYLSELREMLLLPGGAHFHRAQGTEDPITTQEYASALSGKDDNQARIHAGVSSQDLNPFSADRSENATPVTGVEMTVDSSAVHVKSMKRLQARDVTYTPEMAQHPLVKDLSISLGARRTLIVGRPGSGKTTLIELLSGFVKPSQGEISCFEGMQVQEAHRAHCLQNPYQSFFAETIAEDMYWGRGHFDDRKGCRPIHEDLVLRIHDDDARTRRLQTLIRRLDLPEDVLQLSPFVLSGGQARKAALIAALMDDSDWLICDEPSAGLDRASQSEMRVLLEDISHTTQVIIASHDLSLWLPWADEVILLADGTVQCRMEPQELFKHTKELVSAGLFCNEKQAENYLRYTLGRHNQEMMSESELQLGSPRALQGVVPLEQSWRAGYNSHTSSVFTSLPWLARCVHAAGRMLRSIHPVLATWVALCLCVVSVCGSFAAVSIAVCVALVALLPYTRALLRIGTLLSCLSVVFIAAAVASSLVIIGEHPGIHIDTAYRIMMQGYRFAGITLVVYAYAWQVRREEAVDVLQMLTKLPSQGITWIRKTLGKGAFQIVDEHNSDAPSVRQSTWGQMIQDGATLLHIALHGMPRAKDELIRVYRMAGMRHILRTTGTFRERLASYGFLFVPWLAGVSKDGQCLGELFMMRGLEGTQTNMLPSWRWYHSLSALLVLLLSLCLLWL